MPTWFATNQAVSPGLLSFPRADALSFVELSEISPVRASNPTIRLANHSEGGTVMTVPSEECGTCGRRVVERGDKLVIEAALDRDGNELATRFLEALEAGRDVDKDRYADVLLRLEDFAATGALDVPRELNQLDHELWEVKAGDVRLPFYYLEDDACANVRLTHGFVKKSQRAPRKQIDLGIAIIREDRKR